MGGGGKSGLCKFFPKRWVEWAHAREPPCPETCQRLREQPGPQLGCSWGGREPGPVSDFRLVAAWADGHPGLAPAFAILVRGLGPLCSDAPPPPVLLPASRRLPPFPSAVSLPAGHRLWALVLRKRPPSLLAIEGKSPAVPCSEVTWARGILVLVCRSRRPEEGS